MNLDINKTPVGKTSKRTSVVKTYKQNPGNFDLTAHAAHHYAKKNKQEMVIVAGNSYMHRVFYIARKTDDLRKFIPHIGDGSVNVNVVNQQGEVYRAVASR